MTRREKTVVEGGKVAFEALMGRSGGRVSLGLRTKRTNWRGRRSYCASPSASPPMIVGYEGKYRHCPLCDQLQRYKGEVRRELVFDCGALTVQRAYFGVRGVEKQVLP